MDDRAAFDLERVARRLVVAGVVVAAVVSMAHNIAGGQYGFDFHGIWRAAHTIRAGGNPYPAPDARRLLRTGNPFVLPPLLGVLAVPLSFLSFPAAIVAFNAICVAAFLAALLLIGVRDPRVLAVATLSFPFIASLTLGQPDGILALAAAIAWRRRDSPAGALAVGALVAAKLLAWPLLAWLLVTRRVRATAVAVAATIILLLGPWALLGFAGLDSYLDLLRADAHGFERRSHSIVALALRLGTSEAAGIAAAVILGLALTVAIHRIGMNLDFAAFTAAVAFGLVASPILWTHYLVLLYIPLAVSHRRFDAAWLLTALFWISPTEPPPTTIQVLAVILLSVVTALATVVKPQPASSTAAA